jgi:hypothetical protein
LEVHPPEHPVMSWNQFFIHMALVVLGLLIALGLEQSVEAIHHHHQRKELKEAMRRDLEQTRRDSERTYVELYNERRWMKQIIEQGQRALQQHTTFQLPPEPIDNGSDVIADPAFASARASGMLELLSPDDVRAFSEIDTLVTHNLELFRDIAQQGAHTQAMLLRFGGPGASSHWDQATPEDLRQFLNDTGADVGLITIAMIQNQQAYNASGAMLNGERDLQTIYKIEKQPMPETH